MRTTEYLVLHIPNNPQLMTHWHLGRVTPFTLYCHGARHFPITCMLHA